MAKGFINVSTSGSGDVSYYSRSQECLYVQSSKNLSKEIPQLLADWKHIEWQEKMGNKDLGIRGQKDGVTNLHAHLLVNERNLTTRKKDRQMIKKEFLEKEFRPRFEKAFAAERAKGKDLVSRERISTALFQSSPQMARELLESYQRQAVQVKESQAWAQLLAGYAAASEARQVEKLNDLAKNYSQAAGPKEEQLAPKASLVPEPEEKQIIQSRRKGLGL